MSRRREWGWGLRAAALALCVTPALAGGREAGPATLPFASPAFNALP